MTFHQCLSKISNMRLTQFSQRNSVQWRQKFGVIKWVLKNHKFVKPKLPPTSEEEDSPARFYPSSSTIEEGDVSPGFLSFKVDDWRGWLFTSVLSFTSNNWRGWRFSSVLSFAEWLFIIAPPGLRKCAWRSSKNEFRAQRRGSCTFYWEHELHNLG